MVHLIKTFKCDRRYATLCIFIITLMGIQFLSGQNIDSSFQSKMDSVYELKLSSAKKGLDGFSSLYQLAEEGNYQLGLIQAQYGIGSSLYAMGSIGLANDTLRSAKNAIIQLTNGEWNNVSRLLLSKINFSLIAINIGLNNLNRTLEVLEEEKEYIASAKDTSRWIDFYCHAARYSMKKAEYDSAKAFVEFARELNSRFEDPGARAYLDIVTGSIFQDLKDTEQAIELYKRAESYYLESNQLHNLLPIYSNIVACYLDLRKPDEALLFISKKENIQRQYDSKIGLYHTQNNKALLLIELSRFNEARNVVEQNIALADSLGMNPMHSIYLMGVVHRGLDKYDDAAIYIENAVDRALRDNNYRAASFYAHAQYQTYYWKDNFERALIWHKKHIEFRDSVSGQNQREAHSVLQAKLETAEKEKEVFQLEQEKEIAMVKKQRLQLILLSFLIAALGGLFYLNQRRKKQKALREKQDAEQKFREQKLENEKNKLEFELETKQRELTSKALHLAKKSRALNEIKNEIDDRLDANVEKDRILRKINQEIESENDWDEFIKAFRDTHEDFFQKLNTDFEKLSPTDIRMACLLRMNMSTKDIANLMHISTDGVKKARYRLRKKVGAASNVDLHSFFVGL